jgi:hypothetical protein
MKLGHGKLMNTSLSSKVGTHETDHKRLAWELSLYLLTLSFVK